MFKFLKEKIGTWVKKSKEKVEEKSEVEEAKAEKEIQKQGKKVKEKKQKVKQEEKEIKEIEEEVEKQEIKEEKEKVDEKIKETEKELKEAKEDLEKTKEDLEEQEAEEKKKKGFFSKIKESFSYKINKEEFEEIFEGLEMLLLENNVALEVVEKIQKDIKQELVGKEMKKQNIEQEIKISLKKALEKIIIEPDNILDTIKNIKQQGKGPFTILFFGINGAGKTTSIAKFANLLKKNNLSCVLAAGDTFRAASIEQLQIHADKLDVKMIKHDYGADPSAVAFDANKYAKNHNIDVVLIDTAGRMHTKTDLLKEMEKICRVSEPDLKVFVAEAIAGNDATEQAKTFNDMIQIDGSILSKTDVDEKGGTIISISDITNKPILYLGTGQEYKDLELFNKEKFIKQLGLEETKKKQD